MLASALARYFWRPGQARRPRHGAALFAESRIESRFREHVRERIRLASRARSSPARLARRQIIAKVRCAVFRGAFNRTRPVPGDASRRRKRCLVSSRPVASRRVPPRRREFRSQFSSIVLSFQPNLFSRFGTGGRRRRQSAVNFERLACPRNPLD